MSKVLMRSSLQALYLKVSSKLALQTQIWNPDYFHSINDKSMIPRSSSVNKYFSFWIIEFLLISWRNNDFKVFSCESRRWVFVSNFKNQACTIILLYYIFSFLSLSAHQKNYLTLFFPINFVFKKNHSDQEEGSTASAENQFQDYQDLSTSDRGARCRAQSCYNNGKCIEKWLNPICECDMTSFTGPSCSDGKRAKIFKADKFYI